MNRSLTCEGWYDNREVVERMSSALAVPDIDEEIVNEEDEAEGPDKMHHVILLNDEDHTYDYVIEMLIAVFDVSEARAYEHTVEVDTKGHSRIVTLPLKQAEEKRDLVHAFGPDPRLPRSLGSMAALLEPAD